MRRDSGGPREGYSGTYSFFSDYIIFNEGKQVNIEPLGSIASTPISYIFVLANKQHKICLFNTKINKIITEWVDNVEFIFIYDWYFLPKSHAGKLLNLNPLFIGFKINNGTSCSIVNGNGKEIVDAKLFTNPFGGDNLGILYSTCNYHSNSQYGSGYVRFTSAKSKVSGIGVCNTTFDSIILAPIYSNIYDLDEFSKIFQLAKDIQVSFLVQKVIEGPNDCNFEVNTLLFPNGRFYQHSIQKIRQFPDRFGTATSIKSVENPEIEKQALHYLESQNFFGFSNIEFKYCYKTTKYYYIETNPRVWLQVNFSKNIGLNFPLIYFEFLTKGEMPKDILTNLKKGVWVDFFPDILFWLRYRKKYKTSMLTHIGSWRPLLSTGIFSIRDSRPVIREFFNLFKKKK
jgi:hypothetical protein